jgi:hypothetical protein
MKTLEQLSVIELKALVYDNNTDIEIAQKNIQLLNAELKKRANAPKVETKVEEKTDDTNKEPEVSAK